MSIAAKEGYDILINHVNGTFCNRETVAYEAARYIKQRRPKDLVEIHVRATGARIVILGDSRPG